MKVQILAAVAALTLIGTTAAQSSSAQTTSTPQSGELYGRDLQTLPPEPRPYDPLAPYVSTRSKTLLNGAIRDYRKACVPDRESLCAGKTSEETALRCLDYHRLRLSSPCKQAMTNLDLAQRGAL